MKTSLSALVAGALVLGVMTVANADEPVTLTNAQLDNVTAGAPYIIIAVNGDTNTLSITVRRTSKQANDVKKDLQQNGYKVITFDLRA
jgi:hypothetical protein